MEDINLSLDEIIEKKKKNRTYTPANGSAPAAKGGKQYGRAHAQPAKTTPKRWPPNARENTANAGFNRKPKPVVDARLKIIQKQRAKIRDARDKLVQITRTSGDARLRLQRRIKDSGPRRLTRVLSVLPNNKGDGYITKSTLLSDHKGPVQDAATVLMKHFPYISGSSMSRRDLMEVDDDDPVMSVEQDDRKRPHRSKRSPVSMLSSVRTVHNDVFTLPSTMPPLPQFRTVRSVGTIPTPNPRMMSFTAQSTSNDPFGHYEMPRRPAGLTAASSSSMQPYEPFGSGTRPLRSILRTRSGSPSSISSTATGRISNMMPHLSPSMRARLERPPNPKESMGIFAKLPPDDYHYIPGKISSPGPAPNPASPPIVGYRIVVSNLHSSVTQLDIKELFEDIGDLLESRLVRPGVAEVIYRTLRDAEKAVDAYHNRQLDGQPMNCLLVNPRASNKPTAPAMKYGQ
ncbi:uncharacterized protein LOC128728970 [Anopheles nili]|uniref:uncharacterized protein LOC128728970 n=1 Tax=Anopheles nili TaxID=185578 RepID=UPI00237C0B28|nr:uncharacterized protein LOC128728970 [Anopheles nili]